MVGFRMAASFVQHYSKEDFTAGILPVGCGSGRMVGWLNHSHLWSRLVPVRQQARCLDDSTVIICVMAVFQFAVGDCFDVFMEII